MHYMTNLRKSIKECKRCPIFELMPSGCRPVPGIGAVNAEIMLVGKTTKNDDAFLETPFSGRHGKLLDKILIKSGLVREHLYITNIIKCVPPPNNKIATDVAIKSCKNWLWEEIKIIQPKIIVTIGKDPSYLLLKGAGASIKSKSLMREVVGKFIPATFQHVECKIVSIHQPDFLMSQGQNMINDTIDILKTVKRMVKTRKYKEVKE